MTETDHNRVNYLAVVHGQHVEPPPAIFATANAAHAAGCELASQCLSQLEQYQDPKQFPPRLLILLASAAYLEQVDATQLLTGIQQAFASYSKQNGLPAGDVPLLGCSVAAVVFKHPDCPNRVHERGALLICLASRLITAEIAVGRDARRDPEGAIQSLLKDFDLIGKDPNPLSDRILLTFFPGFGRADDEMLYPAPVLHHQLRKGSRTRIHIAGGVAVGNNQLPPLLFEGREIHTDAVIVARVTTGAPIGIGWDHGLTPTGRVVRVSKLGADSYTIAEFDGSLAPAEVVNQMGSVMLGKLSATREPPIGAPRPAPDKQSIRLIHKVCVGDYFEFLRPEREPLLNATIGSIRQALDRNPTKNPLANLLLICSAWRWSYQGAGLDIEETLTQLEAKTALPCLGAFVDGEAGLDATGSSVFGNSGVSGIVFSDEMRERTPLHNGFKALARYGPRMASTESIEEAIEEALQIIVKTGFRGAMLSLVLKNGEAEYVKAIKARGNRFEKILHETCRLIPAKPEKDEYLVSRVVREARENQEMEGRFIADSRDPSHGYDQPAVRKSGLISLYIAPLRQLHGQVLGTLHVDLGEIEELNKSEREVLDSLVSIIGSSLNRMINWTEANIGRELDEALIESLRTETMEQGLQCLIEKAVTVFGVEMGHIRLADPERQKLVMVAGVGPYYEFNLKLRPEVGFEDNSPVSEAFKSGGVTIINVTHNNSTFQQMRLHFANTPLNETLDLMRSYAAVAFENEDVEKLGALSLGSSKEWFFGRPQEMALRALGKRVGFLVAHFNNKRAFQFLIKASPRLADIRDLGDLSGELSKAVKRFCTQAKAQWGSLYLLDEDRQCYVLRAQHGWRHPEWVHAARHGYDDVWTGARATEFKPAIIPDLFQYYQARGCLPRYTKQTLGFELSSENTVEAIGLLLQVGGKKLGYLMLYRKKDGALSGFAVQNEEALLGGASDIAGLVHVLRTNQERQWREAEARRRQEVYNQLTKPDDPRAVETRVCQQVLRSFRARQAHFYRVEQADNETRVFWVDGYQRSGKPETIIKAEPPAPDSALLTLVLESVEANLNVADRPKVLVERLTLHPSQRAEAKRMAVEGLVIRACVPMISKRMLMGILDLHWSIGTDQITSGDVGHDETQLLAFGSMIGSAYRGYQEKLENERSRLAAQGAGAHAFQYSHRLGNAIQNIYRWTLAVKEGSEEQRAVNLENLLKEIGRASEITHDSTSYGERVLSASYARCSLRQLINQSLAELDPDKRALLDSGRLKVVDNILRDFIIHVDFDLTKEAFANLLNNAVKAICDKHLEIGRSRDECFTKPTLTISAEMAADQRNVEIVFEDCGGGMRKEQIEWALGGFFEKMGRKGVGVMIARVLLNTQGGHLAYESEMGIGTKAVVTLPLADKGEWLCLQIPKR